MRAKIQAVHKENPSEVAKDLIGSFLFSRTSTENPPKNISKFLAVMSPNVYKLKLDSYFKAV